MFRFIYINKVFFNGVLFLVSKYVLQEKRMQMNLFYVLVFLENLFFFIICFILFYFIYLVDEVMLNSCGYFYMLVNFFVILYLVFFL